MRDPILFGALLGFLLGFVVGMSVVVWANGRIARKTGNCACARDPDDESYP